MAMGLMVATIVQKIGRSQLFRQTDLDLELVHGVFVDAVSRHNDTRIHGVISPRLVG